MSDIYLGNTEIEKAYIGDTLIYEKSGGGGGGDSDNTWWFCSEYRRFSFELYGNFWVPWGSILNIYMEAANVWFEYNGEKYYVDRISYGSHTLTKQGVPVQCDISQFVQLKITQQGDTYNVFMEDN